MFLCVPSVCLLCVIYACSLCVRCVLLVFSLCVISAGVISVSVSVAPVVVRKLPYEGPQPDGGDPGDPGHQHVLVGPLGVLASLPLEVVQAEVCGVKINISTICITSGEVEVTEGNL